MKIPNAIRRCPSAGECAWVAVAIAVAGCGGGTSASADSQISPPAPAIVSSTRCEGCDEVRTASKANRAGEAAASGCPSDPMLAKGTPCTQTHLECEYGTNDATYCDAILWCDGNQWIYRASQSNAVCTWEQQPPDEACPSEYASVAVDSTCAGPGSTGYFCHYPEGNCACTDATRIYPPPAGDRSRMRWICPVPGSGCPATRPRLGATCASEGLACDYGACVIPGTGAVYCSGGHWIDASDCPQ
jgi:hypothetical protein